MTKSAKRSSTAKEKEPAKRAARQSTKSRSVAEMFAQQKGKRATSSRRNQDEVSSEEEEEGSDSNASDSEQSDSEVEISSNKRRKTAKSLEKRGGTQSTRKQRKKKSTTSPTEVSITHESQLLEQIPSEQNETLYDQVSAPDAEIEEIVAVWVERYRRDKGDALRNLVNFIIRGCGCMNAVTKDAFHRDDIAIAVLEELQEELAKFPQPEYPVISKSKTGKILKRNILNFFAYMVEVCQHDIIYDGSFIETLQNWLTTMSSSVYRPFRHTATILTFRVVKSLCTFADKVNKELQVVTQQLKTENERQTNRARNTQKKRMLEQRSQTLNRKKTNLEEYLNDFFEGVFIHRSRDVESVIRAECIKELCLWTQQYSAHYTNNIYLRHFGWSLNDSNASVRSEALKSISRLYQIEKVVSCLNDFTKRFKRRIEEIALYDIDLSVRLHGIELCYVLFRHDHEMISDECRNELMSLVFLDNERLQKTVAPLVKTVMEAKVLDPMMEETEKALGAMNVDGASTTVAATSTVEKTWISFKCLATFLAERIADEKAKSDSTIDSLNDSLNTTTAAVLDEENGDQLVANAIEALWNQMPMLQDYESLAQYLTRDHSSSHQQDEEELATAGPAAPTPVEECYRLSEEEEAVLIKVFATSLKLITERGFEQVDGKTKDKKKACDEAQLESNRSTISRYLVQVLPRLLTKHSDSTSKMLKLISIPQLMNINVYAELRMQTEYEELLQIVIKVYIGTTLPELLQNCAESLHHMFKVDLLADVNERQFPELMERVTAQVRDACRGKDIATARFDDDDIHATTTSLLRLDYLINFIDVTDMMEESEDMDEDVTELVGHFVDRASYGYKIEKQSSLSAMAILFRYLVWKCERVSVDPELKEVGRAALGKIERRRDWVFEKFTGIVTMTDITPLAAVKSNAFGILMDLYWIFSSDLFATNGLDLLLLSCSENIQKECENYIVSELEKWQEALEKKKNKEAEDDDEVDELEGDNEDDQVEYSGIDLVANVARAVTAKVLDYKYMVPIAAEYGHLEPDADDIIKAFIEETKKDLIGNDSQTDEVCHMYIGILKKAFESHVNQAPRSIDKSVSFARLISQTLHIADQEDPARHVAPHVICDSIHIDGINFALEKAAEHKSHRNRADMGVALKFFKVLSVLVKPLNRARDVAKIHKHIEKCLEELDLTVEPNDKEWDAYHTYIKDIDMILRKKGLRYDNQHVQQQAQQQQ